MPRTTGEETKSAIRAVALDEFASRGHDVPLEDIARTLGITRSAILHHFGSKAALSQDIVAGFQSALGQVLDAHRDAAPPLRAESRNELLAQIVGAYCDHRKVIMMLLRDFPGSWPQIAEQILRLMHLLAGDAPSADDVLVVNAVIGVIVRPLLDPAVDAGQEHTRCLMTSMATQIAERLDHPDRPSPPGGATPAGRSTPTA